MGKINRRRKLSVIIIIAILCGMSAVPSIAGNTTRTTEQNLHKIDSLTATVVASAALQVFGKTGFSLKDALPLINDQGTLLCYDFPLRPQGYIVVSASSDLPPIIAYSFTDNFPHPDTPNVLSDLLTADLTLRLKNIPNLSDSVLQTRHQLWDTYLSGRAARSTSFEQWPPEGSTPTGGWVLTNWDQNPPYNNFCPLDLAHGGRSYAGCPAVAMAQVLNYHNTTNNIHFSDADDYYHNYNGNAYWIDNDYVLYGFPSFPQLNTYLMTLQYHYLTHASLTDNDKAAITFACGVAATQVYSSQGSGTFSVNQAFDAYQRFNCTTAELLHASDADLFPRLSHNMMDALPAHLAVVDPEWSVGHNLVIDGYNTDEFYHLNFGWSGACNGWYTIPDDDMPYDLTVIEGIILDIMKPDTGVSQLTCDGSLTWTNVTPNNTVTGSFTVSNTGEPGSYLDWYISEWPTWGEWTFAPQDGNNLTPEQGTMPITVSVVAPNIENQLFTGQVKVQNIDNSNEYAFIPVSLKTGSKMGADLSCDGSLVWSDVKPGAMVTGSFTVQNIGKALSNLSWEITSWPEWGTWTFSKQNGQNLTPEQGAVTITISVLAPDKKKTEFSGQITVVNSHNSSDVETIPVSLVTPYVPRVGLLELLRVLFDRLFVGFPLLHQFFLQ
jgi:hypothetical protein